MKAIIGFLLIVTIASAQSNFGYVGDGSTSNPYDSSDYIVYSQPYDFSALANGIYVHSPQFGAADNFTVSSGVPNVYQITFWTVFTGSGHPYDIAVNIYEDNGGIMGDHFWGETIPAAFQAETLTGDQSWGFDLYRSDLTIGSNLLIPAGDYWLAMSVLGACDPVGWLVCDPTYPPNMYQYSNGWGVVEYDGFFGIYAWDELSRDTWAGVKSSF